MTEKNICIHGHFYQPPRENPWLEEVEFEESAQPYHDWNDRITAECYAPNSVSRIMDSQGRIIGAVNNYSKISFNFGPTLLSWIERHNQQLYASILEADRESANTHSGHGSAIAQVYNHMIMPLANKRDKETQVIWGIGDFQKRFGRFPEGMWLPETAVDAETLETLAENKIKFTILSPFQAIRIRRIGEKEWTDVKEGKIDPRRAYIYKLPSGKSINLFFFDKFISFLTPFGDILSKGEVFANKLMDGFKGSDNMPAALVSLATDGEIYGHHHLHGDMTLAYCLYIIDSQKLSKITNYAEFLAAHPPEFEVEIQENTSWSCSHGIERWRNDCGDNTGRDGWRQAWRKPLREAMDWLRDQLASRFEIEAMKYLKDPWGARNQYLSVVLDRSRENVEQFIETQKTKELSEDEKKQVLKLLEMQRHAMLMFTSCGWFFDEISGIETVQIMQYAARAMQLSQQALGLELESEYVKMLEGAPSNIPDFKNGANIYNILVKRVIVDPARIAAQGAILQLFSGEKIPISTNTQQYSSCFTIANKDFERHDAGKFRLVIARSIVKSHITLDEATFACVAVWLGDHNVSCGVRLENTEEPLFDTIKKEILESFSKGEINETIMLIPKYFKNNTYSLKDVFKDDQIRILNSIIQEAVKKANDLNEIIYRDNSALLHFMNEIKTSTPKPFRTAAEVVVSTQIAKIIASEEPNLENLRKLISDSKMFHLELDLAAISLETNHKIVKEFSQLLESPLEVRKLESIQNLIEALREIPIKLELWHAQNIAFDIAQKIYNPLKDKKDKDSQAWVSAYQNLCRSIGIRLD